MTADPAVPARPCEAAEVQALVAQAGAGGRRLEIIGGGGKRGICPVTGDAALMSLAAMDRVLDYEPGELVLTAQPGVTLAALEALTAAEGQMLAFEPPRLQALLAAAGAPTLGGALGANLSGPRRIRAGAARDHFLGFEAVSGRGERFRAGGKVVKNVTGYDLGKLMAGSWGTLAVLTEVTIKVMPAPRLETTLLIFGLEPARAAEAMALAMNTPCEVSGAAHLPAEVAGRPPLQAEMAVTALRLEGFEASVSARQDRLRTELRGFGRVDALEAGHSRAFWAQVREVEAFAGDPRPLWRVSVPPAHGWRAAAALPEAGVLFDWAGGLLWVLTDRPAAEVEAAARAVGGHALAYRGGARPAPLPAPLAALTARVKQAFDPLGVLNPGRLAEA